MYRKINHIKETNGLFLLDKKLYTFLNDRQVLGEFNLKGKLLWSTDSSPINYRYHIDLQHIFFYKNYEGSDFTVLNRTTKNIIHESKIELDISNNYFFKNTLYSFVNGKLIVYSIDFFSVIQVRDDFVEGVIMLPISNFIISKKKSYIYIYNHFSLLWQQNIQDFFPKEEEIEIYSIHPYKNTFIVIAKMGIVCLSQKDGTLIWKCDHYARTMEIVGHYGYVCTSLSFYRVDLDTREFYNYNRKYSRLPDFEYNGENHWPSGHKVVYHNGLLWYDVYTSKHPFIIAIDPETATYQWIYEIKDTYEDIEEIRFYDNKMFVTDTGNNLFIYEEKN